MSNAVDKTSDLLNRLAELAERNLGQEKEPQRFLRDQGLSSEEVWKRYRLGYCDPTLARKFSDEDKERLRELGLYTRRGNNALAGGGLLIPTCDPARPEKVTGFIKQSFGQNKHAFASRPPAGIACPVDIGEHDRIIIVDNPLLCLRLAQEGAEAVVIAETPEVLPPLSGWLAEREVVLVSCKRKGLANLKEALPEELRERASEILVSSRVTGTDPDTLRKLGIATDAPGVLIKRIMDYARERLLEGHGVPLLKELNADDPAFVEAYQLGYLSPDFKTALSSAQRRTLGDKLAGGAIVVPAFNESNQPVDLCLVRSTKRGQRSMGFLDQPEGLVAPTISTAHESIVIVDSLVGAASRFKDGQRNVLFSRGHEDVVNNVQRLKASGVREVIVEVGQDEEKIVATLKEAGIDAKIVTKEVEIPVASKPTEVSEHQPEASEKPVLISHDETFMRAKFRAGDITYEIDTALDMGKKLEVRIEKDGQGYRDTFDLGKEAQCKRFAKQAALNTKVSFETVQQHLFHLLDGVREIRSNLLDPDRASLTTVTLTDAEREEALTFLRKQDLLETIAESFGKLGWVGEERLKKLLFLIALSRKLDHPLHAALRSPSGTGKSFGMDLIRSATPEEDIVRVSALTGKALYHHGLTHRLLALDESDILEREHVVQLRVLLSDGSLRKAGTKRDVMGRPIGEFRETEGPVAFMTSTTRELDREILDRCFDLPLDETPEQTKRIIEAQRKAATEIKAKEERENILNLLQNTQRLIEPLPVMIPYAERIEFPATSIRHRREHQRFLRLIEASALLHQHQRMKDGATVIADERDFEVALALAAPQVERSGDELSRNARDVWNLIESKGLRNFTINDLRPLRPDWTRHRFRSGLDELLALEVIASPKRTRPRQYQRLDAVLMRPTNKGGVSLKSPSPFGDLAAFGERCNANTSEERATG